MEPTPNLFDLTGDAARLASRIDIIAEDLDSSDEATVAAAIAELDELIDAQADNREAVMAKADAWAWVINRRRALAQVRSDQGARLAILAAADETAANAMEGRLITALRRAYPGENRFELPGHRITSRRTESVRVDCDPSTLPLGLQRIKVEAEPDRTAIKAAIKAGETVPGCQLVEGRSWKLS